MTRTYLEGRIVARDYTSLQWTGTVCISSSLHLLPPSPWVRFLHRQPRVILLHRWNVVDPRESEDGRLITCPRSPELHIVGTSTGELRLTLERVRRVLRHQVVRTE